MAQEILLSCIAFFLGGIGILLFVIVGELKGISEAKKEVRKNSSYGMSQSELFATIKEMPNCEIEYVKSFDGVHICAPIKRVTYDCRTHKIRLS